MKKITFIIFCFLAINFANAQDPPLTSVGIVGDGAGGWPGQAGNPGPEDINQMTSTDGVNWTMENLTLTLGSAKFRGNNSWDLPYNWGGTQFPSGTGVVDSGDNIPTTPGTYNVTFNSDTFEYNFQIVGGGLMSLAIVGSGAGGWPGEAGNPGPEDTNQMTSTDGINWTLDNLVLTEGSAKFRGNNAWTLPYIWGGTAFPSGIGEVDSAEDIPTVAGTYNVSFNSDTFAYNFEEVLGVEDYNYASFIVYPNPVNGIINIKSNKVITSVVLFDLTGKIILETQKVINSQVLIGDLSPGIYLMRISDGSENTVVKKIVVE